MSGDGSFLDRDIAEQLDLLESLDYDYKNLEFYCRGGKKNDLPFTDLEDE